MKTRVLFFIIFVLVFLCSAFTLTAPWVAEFRWTSGGVEQPSYKAGMILADHGDKKYKLHFSFCNSLPTTFSSTTCKDLKMSHVIMSVIYLIGVLFAAVTAVLVLVRIKVAFFLSAMPFFFQAAGGFGFVFHTLPLFRELIQGSDPTVSVTLKFQWIAIVAAVLAVITFIFSLAFMLCVERNLKEEVVAVAAKKERDRKLEEKKRKKEEIKAKKLERKKKRRERGTTAVDVNEPIADESDDAQSRDERQ